MNKLIEEFKVNEGIKSKYTVLSYRLANYYYNSKYPLKILYLPFFINYKLVVDIIFGVEIPCNINIGWGFKISHAKSITIHPNAQIGSNFHIRHGVTIGNKNSGEKDAPIIDDDVELGCYSSIFGNVCIGGNTIVGAHTLILKSVPKNSIVVGNPGKIIKAC